MTQHRFAVKPQTSFDRKVNIIPPWRTQNDVVLRTNDAMLRINDVLPSAKTLLRLHCFYAILHTGGDFMKRIFALLLCFTLAFMLSACGTSSFDDCKEDREKVVDLILDESVEIAENGLVTLPDEFKNLSDTGECLIVEFQDQSAIYFFEFRGILGESRGYVYVTDQIDWKDYINEDKYTGTEDWIDIEEIETNWYSVKTK